MQNFCRKLSKLINRTFLISIRGQHFFVVSCNESNWPDLVTNRVKLISFCGLQYPPPQAFINPASFITFHPIIFENIISENQQFFPSK